MDAKRIAYFFIIAANLLPLIGALFGTLDLQDIILIYCAEGFILVLFLVLARAIRRESQGWRQASKASRTALVLALAVFFAVLGLLLAAAYCFLLVIMLASFALLSMPPSLPEIEAALRTLLSLWPYLLGLVEGSGYSPGSCGELTRGASGRFFCGQSSSW